jgi:hypothetical protein
MSDYPYLKHSPFYINSIKIEKMLNEKNKNITFNYNVCFNIELEAICRIILSLLLEKPVDDYLEEIN